MLNKMVDNQVENQISENKYLLANIHLKSILDLGWEKGLRYTIYNKDLNCVCYSNINNESQLIISSNVECIAPITHEIKIQNIDFLTYDKYKYEFIYQRFKGEHLIVKLYFNTEKELLNIIKQLDSLKL